MALCHNTVIPLTLYEKYKLIWEKNTMLLSFYICKIWSENIRKYKSYYYSLVPTTDAFLDRLSQEDGLSGGHVTCIAPDNQGFMCGQGNHPHLHQKYLLEVGSTLQS